MAKAPTKKTSTAPKAAPAVKLPNNVILGAIQLNSKETWDDFTPEEQKSVSFFMLNRYLSLIKSPKREIVEHYVLATNKFYNAHFFTLANHQKLLWQLACTCSHESLDIKPMEYIGMSTTTSSKKEKFLATLFPDYKLDDITTMSTITTDDEVRKYCADIGWDDKAIRGIAL